MDTKNPISNLYHNHTQRQMFVQLPFEILDHVVGYLDFEDVRSIARVCSTFRLPAEFRLFRAIRIVPNTHYPYFNHTESILSTPHLLRCVSRLVVQCFDSRQHISFHSLWPRLPMMCHLSSMEISLDRNDCSRALSALESLGSEREIALILGRILSPNLTISDKPLPVHSLHLTVDASNHQVTTRLVQKCSQSLRKLHLIPKDNTIPLLPLIPHLCEFSVHPSLSILDNEPDLMSWFPFLYQHPTITRVSLGCSFILAVQPSPNLLPNLQVLSATPTIIERLIPGRPVDDIHTEYFSQAVDRFPGKIMLRPLQQPSVSVTTLTIITNVQFPRKLLINIVQALPKLRKFTLEWPCYQVRQLFEGRRYSKLTANRFLSSCKTCYLLSVNARTCFISDYPPRRGYLFGREGILFRWYEWYKRMGRRVSGVLNSMLLCHFSKKVVRRCGWDGQMFHINRNSEGNGNLTYSGHPQTPMCQYPSSMLQWRLK